jgi:serine/threonine-protein kinase RsbW
MKEIVELHLSSNLGSEKIAIEKAESLAKKMGFSTDRIEDLKTAVAEACINAIEHGTKFDQETKVGVILTANTTSLRIAIHDQGPGINPENIPKKRTDDSGLLRKRGHGIFIIKELVNEFSYETKQGEGNNVTIIIHLNK